VQAADKLLTTVHEYEDRIVELHFYRCALEGAPRPMLGQELRWVPRAGLGELQFPPADARLIEQLSSKVPDAPTE
jgi:8-oxo-dGTP diphosphatase